jgi:hypothetical protein
VTQSSEQDIQHINRLGTVSLTRSDQLKLDFVISVVIPHTPNSDHHGRPTVLRFVVVWFFYVARYVVQRSKILDFPNGPIGPWVMWVSTSLLEALERLPFYSEVEHWTQKCAASQGIGGTYGHEYRPIMSKELLHFDMAVVQDGAIGGMKGAIYRR